MITIKCNSCGEEILVVPDPRKMCQAIENHINKFHRKLFRGEDVRANLERAKNRMECIKLRESLLNQIIDMIAERRI